MKKRILRLLLAMLPALLLGGCAARTIDEMYALPRMSQRNSNLRTAIESAMQGKVYAAPVSGDNRESVQTADLDGDGREEYLIFAKSTEGDSLQVLLFNQMEDENYALWETIHCKGASFEQVHYASIDDSPGCELIIGTRLSETVTKTVSVYTFSTGAAEKVKSMVYAKLLVCDLDEDGHSELLLIQSGEGEYDAATLRLYGYGGGTMAASSQAGLSVAPQYVSRITQNFLSGGVPAVYVSGVFTDNEVVTDIFALRNGVLTSISRSGGAGNIMQPLSDSPVYPEDLDGDGMLELPGLISMMYNATGQNMIRWYTVDLDGEETNKFYTFHNFDDGWYIRLESDWIDRFAAEENGSTYTFFMWNNSYGSAVPVFTVFSLTGRDKDAQASAQNRFPLYRGEDVVIAAKLESGSAIYGMTEDYLKENFHLIRQSRSIW